MLLSYVRSRPNVSAEDIGLLQQLEIFDYVRLHIRTTPPVIDAAEFLKDPQRQLRALCAQLGIEFTERMLHWPAGARSSDGVWAPYWYGTVLSSSGFEPYRERDRHVPPEHRELIEAVMPAYEMLFAHHLTSADG